MLVFYIAKGGILIYKKKLELLLIIKCIYVSIATFNNLGVSFEVKILLLL